MVITRTPSASAGVDDPGAEYRNRRLAPVSGEPRSHTEAAGVPRGVLLRPNPITTLAG
jgi:hypothetical protein